MLRRHCHRTAVSPSTAGLNVEYTRVDEHISGFDRKVKSNNTSHLKSDNNNSPYDHATKTADPDPLPIHPKITPAIGIVGALLIITGAAYCIIGIKHQWLLVFLSSAFMASLGVTVLIIYVMTPPVSDAIQGAYFVAAFMTGVIFGAIALVFKEMTEGLACMCGGFCLSMWFLCVRSGGLVQSETGRAIMIGVFTAVGWSLSFSHYTRNYGLIICSAFGGAMITILGVDCFSRAGLKEFWIYNWGELHNVWRLTFRSDVLTMTSSQQERIPDSHHDLPRHSRYQSRDRVHNRPIPVRSDVPIQDLEDRERAERKERRSGTRRVEEERSA